MRCDAKEPIEGVDAVAVGQEEVSQHRRYGIRSSLLLLCFADQSLQTVGAASDPFDLEGSIGRPDQRLPNDLGIRRLILNEKYFSPH